MRTTRSTSRRSRTLGEEPDERETIKITREIPTIETGLRTPTTLTPTTPTKTTEEETNTGYWW